LDGSKVNKTVARDLMSTRPAYTIEEI